MPLLHYYSQRNRVFDGYVLVLILHLLRDSLPFISALKTARANPKYMFVIGIPYSYKRKVVEQLKKQCPNVAVPISYPFDDEVKKTLTKALDVCRKTRSKIIIIEDGGYAVPCVHKDVKDVIVHCIGAVEQTTNGIWRDEELLDKGLTLGFPILSIPDCRLKKSIEPKFVGEAVVQNVRNLLSRMDDFVAGKKVCVVGYGTIGEYIAKEAKNQNAIVSVADMDHVRLLTARFNGFITDSLENLLRESDIVIGATGRVPIKREGILKLKNNAILVNASSKQLEFDIKDLERLSIRKTRTDIGTKYELANGNNVFLLADGFPVNFFSSESVPGKIIDLILTLLFLGAVLLVRKKMKPKIYKWTEEDKKEGIYIEENDVAKLHHDIYFP